MTHTVYETSGHFILEPNVYYIPAACFAARPEPQGWRDEGWTGGRKRKTAEARQDGGSEARERRKKGRREDYRLILQTRRNSFSVDSS